jgi:DNA-binding Lrp family transcriptional regulator
MKEEKLLKLLKALLENSKRSDRELAKAIDASQPTVTRNRKTLSKYIRSYTIVPEFAKVGYEIIAFTFARARTYDKKLIDSKLPMVDEWLRKHANVLFASDGEGLGKDLVVVSLHKDYSKYANFMREYILSFADVVSDVQSFIVSLKTGMLFKPFDLTYLADDVEGPL